MAKFPRYARNRGKMHGYLRVAETLRQAGVPWISFVGGEPLLFSSTLRDLFVWLAAGDIGYGFSTNWSLPPKGARDLIRYAHSINLSFDSINPEYRLSTKNDCRRLLDFIAGCKDINPRLVFNATLVFSRESADDLLPTMQWLFSVPDIRHVFVQPNAVKKYQPSAHQAEAIRAQVQLIPGFPFDRCNLQELLGYFFCKDKLFLRKNCGMFFSQVRVFSDTFKDDGTTDFFVKPCSSFIAERAKEDWSFFPPYALYDPETFSWSTVSFSRMAQQLASESGGFFGTCNSTCSCGPEMIMNEVFWGKRKPDMLSRDAGVQKRIAAKLRHNRETFEAFMDRGSHQPITVDAFSNCTVDLQGLKYKDILSRSYAPTLALPAKTRSCIRDLQRLPRSVSLREVKKKYHLNAQEYDALAGVLFRSAARRYPHNARSIL